MCGSALFLAWTIGGAWLMIQQYRKDFGDLRLFMFIVLLFLGAAIGVVWVPVMKLTEGEWRIPNPVIFKRRDLAAEAKRRRERDEERLYER